MISIGINRAAKQARLAREVNAEREKRLTAGTTVSVSGVGSVPVQGRPEDRMALNSLGMAAQMLVAGGDHTTVTKFRDGNNVIHNLNPDQMLALWRGSVSAAEAIYAAAWALKDTSNIPEDFSNNRHWPF